MLGNGIGEYGFEENTGYDELEQYDLDNYATHTNIFDDDDLIETDTLTPPNNWFCCDNNDVSENVVPTTNAGDFALKAEEVVQTGPYVSCHVIMNQCGSLLTREKSHQWFQATDFF